jgi:hypothetical protein
MQNGFAESFNGRLRDECLNKHLFANLREAQGIIEEWRTDYNTNRPHTSLNGLTRTSSQHAPARGKTGTDSTYERGQIGEQVSPIALQGLPSKSLNVALVSCNLDERWLFKSGTRRLARPKRARTERIESGNTHRLDLGRDGLV